MTFNEQGTVSSNVKKYIDKAVTKGRTYYYIVRAYYGTTLSTYSAKSVKAK